MSPLHKKIAAAAAVAAAASVWIARFVGDGAAPFAATAENPAADGSVAGSVDSGDDRGGEDKRDDEDDYSGGKSDGGGVDSDDDDDD